MTWEFGHEPVMWTYEWCADTLTANILSWRLDYQLCFTEFGDIFQLPNTFSWWHKCYMNSPHVNITSQIWPNLVQICLIMWYYDTSWHHIHYFISNLVKHWKHTFLKNSLTLNRSLWSMVTCCHLVAFHKTGPESAPNALQNIQTHKCTL